MAQIKLGCVFLSLIFLSACGGGGSSGGDGTSTFVVPSSIVSAVFRDCLESQAIEKGWRNNSDVRNIECQRDYSVSDWGIGVESLEGVQAFSNLEEIVIYGSGTPGLGRITDLSPLMNLGRLHTIEMYESSLQSLESIRGKSSLQRFVVIPTSFSDLSPVVSLTNLKHLNLSLFSTYGQPISDFSPLSQLSGLEELHLQSQDQLRSTGLGFLSGMSSLRLLNISENALQSADGIQYLPRLESLDLSYNNLFLSFDDTEIQALLSGLVNLKQFWYAGFDGQSLSFLQGMQGLELLTITRYYSLSDTDLTIIGALTNLRELYLGGFANGDVSLLQGLSNLQVLWIADSNVDSATLAFPATLASLRELYMLNAFRFSYDFGDSRGDFKNSYDVFKDLPILTDLHLDKPWLLNESAVTLNTNVTSLSLVSARLDSIEFLRDVSRIRQLDLSNNPFLELDALASMPDLQQLVLNDTSVSCEELDSFQTSAPSVEVITDLYCP